MRVPTKYDKNKILFELYDIKHLRLNINSQVDSHEKVRRGITEINKCYFSFIQLFYTP